VEAHGIASFEGSGPLRHAANFVGTVEDITGRKKAEEEMLRLNRALRILSECNEALVRAASEEGLLQRVCELIGNIGGYTLVWVGLVDGEDAGILRIAASRAAEPGYLERICITPDRYEFRDGPAGCAMKTGRPVLVRDAQTDPRFGPWREAAGIHGYSSILCLPLQAPDRVLGTVAIYADHVDGFDSEEIALLAEMSNDLAYGIFSLRAQAEREQAEASLTASEERYRALVDSAPGGIIVYNDVGIVYANSVAVALCGLDSFEQLRERGILGVIHPEERAEVAKRMRQGLSGQDLPMRETRLLRPDGTVAFIDTIARPVQYGGSAAVQVYVHDITERKRSEEQLRKLSVAVQQSTVIVVITGLNGVIEYVNPMFTEVTGYATEEVIGLTPRILKSGETPREEYEVLWKTITSGGEWRGEFHNRRKDGTLYWERALIAPVRNSAGAMTHFLAIKEDITQQKVLEEQYRQAQKMEAVGQLAGGVAHDFNNILQSMLGYSGLLVDRLPKESETREFANEIARGTERATALTRQLLAFSRRQVLEMKDLDVNDVVHGVVKMIRRLIGEDIEVQVAATCRLGTVHADAGQLEQVLLNLCVNARDAMPGGGMLTIETDNVTIDAEYCETHSWAAPGMYLLLSVTDTGHGMDAQTQARIFEPFFTTKELGKGTGLGLATVYGIVKQHNGMIQVYSEAGRGTAFKIYLPSVERAATTKESENAKPVQGGTETILVAEDDEVVRKLAVRILRLSGYTVLEATDGQEALEVFQQYAADIALLLLDVVMPKLGGKAVYEALKPKHPHLQFLFSSGYSANAIHTGFVLDEGIELIQKPYGPTALLRRVRDILDESKPETDL
jgi:two-component system NtrC family sensor kinase